LFESQLHSSTSLSAEKKQEETGFWMVPSVKFRGIVQSGNAG